MNEINLFILRTNSLERSREFYEQTFNITFEEHIDHGPKHYGTQCGNIYLELYPTKQPISSTDSIGLEVDSLETIINSINPKRIKKQIHKTSFGRSAIIKDPDERLIYLTER